MPCTSIKPLGRLSPDPESEDAESDTEDKLGDENASTDTEKATRHLRSIYQRLYTDKDPRDFADGWLGVQISQLP